MDLDRVIVADIETDGFLDELTRLHVLGVSCKDSEGSWKIKTTNKESDVLKLFKNSINTIAGHNFYLYDVPSIEKLYGIDVRTTVIDTLFLSWYLEPNRLKQGKRHGLESYGVDYGVPKPVIDDWENLPYETYVERVTEDVRINTNLYHQQYNKLKKMYEGDTDKIKSLINFLMTKGKQYKMHQDNPLRIDIKQAQKNKNILEEMIDAKIDVLSKVMPKVPIKVTRKKPKTIHKKNGELSKAGERWKRLTDGCKLPLEYGGEIEEVIRHEEPNPQSVKQVKDWLFSLGWKPRIFNESVLKSGQVNKVPQIKDKNKDLCPSVLSLAEKEPAIKELDDLGVIQHRLGIVKGFLRDCDEDGNIVAGVAGLTNTLRIRHKYLVNMPKPSAPYGEYIRSLILPQEGNIMIGSDLSGLENITRNNFILPYDSEYVAEMDDKYYDSHLAIGVTAGLVSESESVFYRWWKEKKKTPNIKPEDIGEVSEDYRFIEDSYKTDEEKQGFFDKIDKVRQQAKTVSYSALYGVGKTKLAKELKITQKEAKVLLDAYWKKNWSVRKFASDCETKSVDGQMWVRNPLNGYFYSLRSEKDIFSTVNQGTGDYIFTLWVHFLMEDGVTVQGGFHDEIICTCPPEKEKETVKKIYSAIDKVNRVLGLKIPVGIDYHVGKNYAKVH